MSAPGRAPENPTLEGIEGRWAEHWEQAGTYRFDRSAPRAEVYSIDTPPPTVSGSLHVGHVFSYTHTDTVARYRRMRGRQVFYPMGWDDNGLPTERRVQNFYGVRCDPSLPYDAGFQPPAAPGQEQLAVSRRNFVELCQRLVVDDEAAFEALYRRLGLSVDWAYTYTTIGIRARRVAQRAFLRNLARGEAYQAESPTLWDVDFRTAVAQAELEERDTAGAYHRLAFHGTTGSGTGDTDDIHIETTRPELLAACVALVAHPDDARYQGRFGTTVRTPLYGVEVPVLAHQLADPEKGSGIAMICTFGDTTDVTWWRELDLPVRGIVGRDGRVVTEPPEGVAAGGPWTGITGRNLNQAQRVVVDQLRATGELVGEPRPIRHPVKYYEKGDRPLEIVTSRQWYLRNGGRDPGLRQALLARGRSLAWHPGYMQARYENWVEGLTGDWLVSRQRYFGVPFPVWYPVGDDGSVDWDHPLAAGEAELPVDPSSDAPPGYTEDQRGEPGGFVGDPDVMDTWATSSLSPQVASCWEDDPDLFGRVFPMDLRPQAHDIIRTWLFSTVARAHLEHGSLPWSDAAISGFVLDPDRKKMSKSRGNAVTPVALLERFGSDAVRYWAARGRPGTDAAFAEGQMKDGRRLANKLLNASKLILGFPATEPGEVTEAVDRAMLGALAPVVESATAAFDGYDYARALERTESFFWTFCDDHLELVKARAYGGGPGAASAQAALRLALSILLRLFAPFLPFVTEEAWSWWQEGSVHRASWPVPVELAGPAQADPALLALGAEVLTAMRRAKTAAQLKQSAALAQVVVRGDQARLAAARAAAPDLASAGSVIDLVLELSPHPSVQVRTA
ncbi:MAG: valine--tRNA ligase [Acidimicrobiales bacterium]